MPDVAVYGDNTKTFPFALLKDGVPVEVTLGANDVWLIKDNSVVGDVTSEVSIVPGTSGTPHILYIWSPSAASQLQASDSIILSVVDYSGDSAFDSNRVVIYTGGHVNARYSG